jgi:hypothetical protein
VPKIRLGRSLFDAVAVRRERPHLGRRVHHGRTGSRPSRPSAATGPADAAPADPAAHQWGIDGGVITYGGCLGALPPSNVNHALRTESPLRLISRVYVAGFLTSMTVVPRSRWARPSLRYAGRTEQTVQTKKAAEKQGFVSSYGFLSE